MLITNIQLFTIRPALLSDQSDIRLSEHFQIRLSEQSHISLSAPPRLPDQSNISLSGLEDQSNIDLQTNSIVEYLTDAS